MPVIKSAHVRVASLIVAVMLLSPGSALARIPDDRIGTGSQSVLSAGTVSQPGQSAPSPDLPNAVPGVLIVKTRGSETPLSLGKKIGVSASSIALGRHNTAQMRTPRGKSDAQFRKELEARSDVLYASPVYFRTVDAHSTSPDDPYYRDSSTWTDGAGMYAYGLSWWLRESGISASTLWTNAQDTTWGVRAPANSFPVAVIDTGAYLTHPDLTNAVAKRDEFDTYVESTGVLTTDTDVTPIDPARAFGGLTETSHGTFVAGQISATTNNGIGVASGTYDTPVWIYKVEGLYYNATYPDGIGLIADLAVINAIYDATDDGAKVINISLGGDEYSPALQDAIDYAYARGVLVVGASGNAGVVNGVQYPGANNHVTCLGAFGLDSAGARVVAPFSNSGVGRDAVDAGANNGQVDIVAPGVMIWGLVRPDWDADGANTVAYPGYTFYKGTSMAAPAFSAAAALMWRFGPDLSPDALVELFTSTATSTGDAGDGAGYLNVASAYAKLKTIVPDRTPPAPPGKITATVTGKTSVSLQWWSSFDVSQISKYSIYLADGTKMWESVPPAYPPTFCGIGGLQPGTTYTFYVTATDGAGNESAPSPTTSAHTWPEVDLTPPPPPEGLHGYSPGPDSIDLDWLEVTDESEVTTYSVYLEDGTPLGSTPITQKTIYNLQASTAYTFYVTATDRAGNESAPSATVTVTTKPPPDTTPPAAPTGVTAEAQNPTTILVRWDSPPDSEGVRDYRIYNAISNQYLATVYAPSTGHTFYGVQPDATYGFYVVARDQASNYSAKSATVWVTTPPIPPDETPPAPPASVHAYTYSTTSIGISWSQSTDPSGIQKYTVYSEAGERIGSPQLGREWYSFEGLQPDTTYGFYVTATDNKGNESAPSQIARATTYALPTLAVHRFYNVTNGTHFYTSSQDEKEMVISRWPNIYRYEGIAYWTEPAHNTQPLYRFYNRSNGSHFYTASQEEANTIIANWSNVYSLDGQTYSVCPQPVGNCLDVYRFYNKRNGSHFYTASAEERDLVIAQWSATYTFEGYAFFVAQ